MAIFGTNNSTGLVEEFEHIEYAGVMPTMESSDQMLLEFAEDLYKIQAGMYITDVIIEQQAAVTESADIDTLLEGVFKDMFVKIKTAIKKLWDTITEWFKKVFTDLKMLLTRGETFVKEYGKVISEKAGKAKGYQYKGYQYDITAAEKISDAASSEADKILDKLKGFSGTSVKDYKDGFKELNIPSDEFTKSICTKVAGNGKISISDVKSEMLYLGRGKSEKKENIYDMDSSTAGKMLDFIKGYKRSMDTLNKAKSATDTSFNKLLKGYNDLEKSLEGKSVGGITAVINTATTNSRICISLRQGTVAVLKNLYVEMYHTYMRVLKGLIVYRPAKEGFEEPEETGTSSILESAMELI